MCVQYDSRTGSLSTVAKMAIGTAAGAGSSAASQVANGRAIDSLEIAVGGAFGLVGGRLDFGSGAVGAFRGLVAGGAMSVMQQFVTNFLDDFFASTVGGRSSPLAGTGK